MKVLPELTEKAVTDYIPRLLANLHVECLVYGNCEPDLALQLYSGVVRKLREDCRSGVDIM